MFATGGGVKCRRVIGPGPLSATTCSKTPGDLPVIHNYRNVPAPILSHHGAGNSLGTVFPDFAL